MKATMLLALKRLILFAILWMILTGGQWKHVGVAILGLVATTVTSLYLWPARSRRVRWRHLPSLVCYFLWHSFRGGVDVARRAFSPAMPMQPEFIEYVCRLESEKGRVLFTWMIGLMPGTASVNLEDHNRLTVHVIDPDIYDEAGLRQLEDKLAEFLESP